MATIEDSKDKLRELRKAAEEFPDSPDKWMDYARFLALKCNNPSELIRAIEHLAELLPGVDWRRKLGRAYIAKGDLAKGIALIKESVADYPSAEAFCYLGTVCFINDMFEEAREACLQAMLYDPEYAEAYNLMGEATETFSKESAINWYRQAIHLDPEYQEAWMNLGRQLVLNTETAEEGVVTLRKALELEHDDKWARLYLARGLWRLDRIDEARREYENVIKRFPSDNHLHRWYGQFLQSIGDERSAENEFRLAESLRIPSKNSSKDME